MGRFVNYANLPNVLWDSLFVHFGLGMPDEREIERMREVSNLYSKQGGGQEVTFFHGDAADKQQRADKAIRDAANVFLRESFRVMEHLSMEQSSQGLL
mmetsp:Transcript_25380/g.59019  ORF Transcript_25380/g.59019 Transcript_25380/m.59019 type:complete len:98 (-) Transcript_25380:433-726(-)|eukprot:CAMPEP_0116868886 /NCGR_PEP_ID=MMETSP0418-20121206/27451_1 /TAXON_ID=1158023 /ORGANISM="Astrosyne radiata, Strain 13vi08-1A" /LENGTH=97 /DNA_ID=CAMNT_0004504917 /DNA_START=183 /DNA_END=476 /DNA_ORIENTATION=-